MIIILIIVIINSMINILIEMQIINDKIYFYMILVGIIYHYHIDIEVISLRNIHN